MRILLAPQALKGSLTAAEAVQAMVRGVRAVAPAARVIELPIADGGEGTVEAMAAATGGTIISVTVTGPLGEPVEAFFLQYPQNGSKEGDYHASTVPTTRQEGEYQQNPKLSSDSAPGEGDSAEKTAVIEMAAASGLPLVPPERRDPRITTTRGTGELIRHALDLGCRRLLIGIGGSATNDGGAGMVQALGGHLLDEQGQELPPGGAALARLARIDTATLDPRLRECVVQVACDVDNPLCGPNGASAIYGPQKGATPTIVHELDEALHHYAAIIKRDLGADVLDLPGAGAAGGLGAGLVAFLNAELLPGSRMVLDALHFDAHLAQSDLVLTAEGNLDAQTLRGKSVGAVAAAARARGVPVIVMAGGVSDEEHALYEMGIAAIVPLPTYPMPLSEAMSSAAPLVSRATERALRLLRVGESLAGR